MKALLNVREQNSFETWHATPKPEHSTMHANGHSRVERPFREGAPFAVRVYGTANNETVIGKWSARAIIRKSQRNECVTHDAPAWLPAIGYRMSRVVLEAWSLKPAHRA